MINNEFETVKYYMAAEKVEGLIHSIDMLLEFVAEFKITPDDGVKEALMPCVDKVKEWLK